MVKRWFVYGCLLWVLSLSIFPSAFGQEQALFHYAPRVISERLLDSLERIPLENTFRFYSDTLLDPSAVFSESFGGELELPGSWTHAVLAGSKDVSAFGVATLGIELVFPVPKDSLALFIQEVRGDFDVYANGMRIYGDGEVDDSPWRADVSPFAIPLPVADTLAIVFHIKNELSFPAGIILPLWLGKKAVLVSYHKQLTYRELFVMGCLIIIGAYHLFLVRALRPNSAALSFGLICLLFALLIGVINSHPLHLVWPHMPYGLALRIEYGIVYSLPLLFGVFFRSLFPVEFPPWLFLLILIPGSLLLATLLIPNSWFTQVGSVSDWLVLFIGPTLLGLVILRAIARKRQGAKLILMGFVVFLVSAINDILFSHHVVTTGALISYGLLFLIIFHSAALAKRLGFAFAEVADLKRNLEARVQERTSQLEQRSVELVAQRDELRQKHEDIQASLLYAKRLQSSILTPSSKLHELFPLSFVFLQPKEFVSGDFYWFGSVGTKKFVVVADCTGRGIQGAFLTILGTSLLNQIIYGQGITHPEAILGKLDGKLTDSFRQQKKSHQYDGMDVGVLMVDDATGTAIYSGARLSMVYIHNGLVDRIIGSRNAVGGMLANKSKVFGSETIFWEPGNRVYLYTDGFGQQFGGDQNKKYKAGSFRKLLQELSLEEDMFQQGESVRAAFSTWKGAYPQTDDVLVVGMEL